LVYAHLSKTHKASVVRHSTEEGTATKWRSFQNKQETSAIVCGPNAEEGLNLQGGAKAVVHFDLPMEPGRVEQRMGRVDRYGSGSAIHSTVLVDDGSILQMSWYQLLAKGLGVFSQSIASLQYFIEEEMRSLRRGLFDNGSERFENLLADFSGPSGKVSQELRLIDQQDSLDELSSLPDSQSSLIEDVDSDWKSISGAVGRWVVDTLLFEKVIEGIKPERKSPEPPYRFRYHKPRGAGAATLLPLSALLEDFIGALDLDAPESSSSQPLTYRYTAHRKTAVSWGARVLRYGDAFVEAVKSFTTTDDRGRCFGIWRQHPGGPEAGVSMYFRFDFVVQIALDDAQATLRNSGFVVSDAAYAAIRRRGDALFAPTATRIWVTEDGELVDKRLIEQCLDLPYSKEPGAAEYTDTNLQSARIHTLIENRLELFASWPDRCANARDRAHHHVLQDEYFLARQAEALDAAIRKNSLRNAQLSARVSTLEGVEAEIELAALALETALGAALREGIATPSVRLDVMGFVVLSRGIPPLDAANRGTTT
jgi:ATP-dependent helicase HepA